MIALFHQLKCFLDINRITVEFKFSSSCSDVLSACILIESQWNLNQFWQNYRDEIISILIESQWNLNIL